MPNLMPEQLNPFPKVAIIILNWNGLKDTIECLESVKKIDYLNFEIIVVDNGSTDGSPEKIKEMFPDITLIRNKENLGYASGNNVGIRYALKNNAEYILMLNNDTVVDKNILSIFVETIRKEENVGSLGGKVFYYKKKNYIHSAGGIVNNIKGMLYGFNRGEGEIDYGQYEKIVSVDYIMGCALFFALSTIEKVGLFNEQFFLYCEDTDFGLRIKKAGLHNLYVPYVKIWHKVSASTGWKHPSIYYYDFRSRLLLTKLHGFINSKLEIKIFKWTFYEIKKLLKSKFKLRFTAIIFVFWGLFDFWCNRFGKAHNWIDIKIDKFLEYKLWNLFDIHIRKYLSLVKRFFLKYIRK